MGLITSLRASTESWSVGRIGISIRSRPCDRQLCLSLRWMESIADGRLSSEVQLLKLSLRAGFPRCANDGRRSVPGEAPLDCPGPYHPAPISSNLVPTCTSLHLRIAVVRGFQDLGLLLTKPRVILPTSPSNP